MSETAAGGIANPSDRIKLGTVGTPLPGLESSWARTASCSYAVRW